MHYYAIYAAIYFHYCRHFITPLRFIFTPLMSASAIIDAMSMPPPLY
jgi:hypothetical protein